VLRRDDPLPGLPGLRSWTASASLESFPQDSIEPDGVRFRAFGAGREFSGDAIITKTRVSSTGGMEITINGTGPLDGFDEALLD
jgi:hypothetical protein